MSQPYIGEIRQFAGNFAPSGWMFCDGSILPIAENEALFQLIGTTYGGDGQTTFALPNLQSRAPIHMGTGPDGTTYQIGRMAGSEEETLTVAQIPAHSHPLIASTDNALSNLVANNIPAAPTAIDTYRGVAANVPLDPSACGAMGGSQPHHNMQPYLCINHIISLFGIFPSQT